MKNDDENMLAATFQETPLENKDIHFSHKVKMKLTRKKKLIFSCIAFLVGFVAFANFYVLPLPFDTYRMSVELVPHAVVVDKNGRVSWEELRSAVSRGTVPEDYKHVTNVLVRKYQGINGIGENSVGRTINRNGEDVRVVYYCYTKTLLDSLFLDPDLQEYSEAGTSTGTDLYGDSFETMAHEPQMTEVYYLPLTDLYNSTDELSDAEYDELRGNCDLIWSGTI